MILPFARVALVRALIASAVLPALACRGSSAIPRGERSPGVELTWFSVTNLHLRAGSLSIVTDGYVTRIPRAAFSGGVTGILKSDRRYRPDSAAVARAWEALHIGGSGTPVVVLSGHSHFDHSFDTAMWWKLTGARIVGPRTTCLQTQAQRVPAPSCTAVYGGERIELSHDVTVWVVRWNHSGDPAVNPELHNPVELREVPVPDSTGALRPGVSEDFPNGGGARAYLIVARTPQGSHSVFFHNTASPVDLHLPIVTDAVDYGAPLDNLRRAMQSAGLDRVDLWIGAGGAPIAELLLPVLRPKAHLPVHFDSFYAPMTDGLPAPFSNAALEAVLARSGVTLVRPAQFLDRWRLDATGVHALDNAAAKRRLGLPVR